MQTEVSKINKETILDLKVKIRFNIATLNSLGGEVLSNIRGSIQVMQVLKAI
jgi:hypothetical protein